MTAAAVHLELPIEGMSCASCAARVEGGLNALQGVAASVNYATGRASVDYDAARVDLPALVAAVERTGYGVAPFEEPAAAPARDAIRLATSAVLAAVVVLLSLVSSLQFAGWRWVALVLATPVVAWGGASFHLAAARHLRHRTATMDTLISLGTLSAYAWSLAVVALGSGRPVYFDAAAAVTVFLLLGRSLEARARRRAGAAIRALLEVGAKDASLLEPDGGERRIPVAELRPGDRFVVRPGEKVATDGRVVEGRSALDLSILTGESTPVEAGVGAGVTGASVNLGGRIVVEATRVGEETALAQIARLVERAQSGKAPVQRLADRVAGVFVPLVLVLSLATLGGWLAAGAAASTAFTAAVAVLVVACPCALGLATPTALLVGSGRGAQLGIVIRGPEILESTRRVDTVLLDKTGTVTEGKLTLREVVGPREEALRLAGSVEHASEHPLGRAIAAAASRETTLAPVEDFRGLAGLGVEGVVDGTRVLVGRPGLLADEGFPLSPRLAAAAAQARTRGETAVAAAWDGAARAVLTLADVPKPSSRIAVEELVALGLRPVLLSGDAEETAHAVAAEVGVGEVIAGVLPSGKAEVVARLQREGHVVAMVGDGVNDAPALARADLGIAIGTGSDVAIEASDLTLVSGDLRGAADAIRLSRRTLTTIKSNLVWAFAYNVVALPLAAAGYLGPLGAGAAMAFSSVLVVANSLRLRRFRPLRSDD